MTINIGPPGVPLPADFLIAGLRGLMVRSASSRVSNHEAPAAAILRDGADAPPQDEVIRVSGFEFRRGPHHDARSL